MGKYINQTSNGAVGASFRDKCSAIMADGATPINGTPTEFVPNLVCVVDNGYFGAAAYCYDEGEFRDFTWPGDYRPKKWFTWDKVEQFAD